MELSASTNFSIRHLNPIDQFMKKSLSLFIATALLLGGVSQGFSQEKKKPQTWEEKAAARLKPVDEASKKKILAALSDKPLRKPGKDRKVLVFWRCGGFIHTSIPNGNFCLEQMGIKSGAFTADISDKYGVFTKENLKQYDAIIFNNTTHLVLETEAQQDAIVDFLKQGKGVVGIHAAGDNFYKWAVGAAMIGGQLNGHPWSAGGKWAFKLDDPDHILNQAFLGKGFWHKDEIYQYKPSTYEGEENLRILVSLDMSKKEVSGILDNPKFEKYAKQYGKGPRQVPVSWLREFKGGRVFFSNLGHREDTFWQPTVLQHFLDGIQYALGDLDADATPTAKTAKKKPVLAPAK